MPKVKILPPEVIAKIAAGEVIERPASVLKELMENSLDAGATKIEVKIEDAGKQLIKIKDNGSGMEKADLENIFQRHATSKLKKIEDLYEILSLGFRGEALYSIAAVSDVILRSRTENDESGWEIHLRGGQRIDLRPVGMERGTEIEVKELFFNTPARKKFLKSNSTELNQILNVFLPYTILYPQTRFILSNQGKDVLQLPPIENLKSRIAHAFNLEEKYLLEAKQNLAEQNISVRMVLGDINIQRSRRDLQFIFINGRPVQNRAIHFHMGQVYRLLFPSENHPFYSLYLNVPPEDVDVNMHPTKREVKVRDEQTLASVIRNLAEQTLMQQGQAKQAYVASEARENNLSVREKEFPWNETPVTSQESNRVSPTKSTDFSSQHYAFQNHSSYEGLKNAFVTQQENNLQQKLSLARFIGVFMKKFLLFENGSSLFLIDQHAAQERIMFEYFREQIENGKVEVQPLLSPMLIKLTLQEILAWEEAQTKLREIGLETTLFDKETLALHTVPTLIKNAELAHKKNIL